MRPATICYDPNMRAIMRHPVFRAAAFVAGLMLVVAAVVFALRGVDWRVLQQADPAWIGLLMLLVVVNLLLTGAIFWQVNLSFDARPVVSLWRMQLLITASSLLNYLPLRPGLLGRSAYLKARHGMPLRQSVQVLAIVMSLSVLVALLAVLIAVLPNSMRWAIGAAALLLLSAVMPVVSRFLLKRPVVHAWCWLPLRAAEVLIAAARLWLAFSIVGHDMAFWQVLAAAAAGFVVSLTGLTPNGLGLREWTIAAITALAVPELGPAGALAAVLDRAAEAIVFTLLGLGSIAALGGEMRSPSPQES